MGQPTSPGTTKLLRSKYWRSGFNFTETASDTWIKLCPQIKQSVVASPIFRPTLCQVTSVSLLKFGYCKKSSSQITTGKLCQEAPTRILVPTAVWTTSVWIKPGCIEKQYCWVIMPRHGNCATSQKCISVTKAQLPNPPKLPKSCSKVTQMTTAQSQHGKTPPDEGCHGHSLWYDRQD